MALRKGDAFVKFVVLASLAAFLLTGASASASTSAPPEVFGVWANPKDTVHIDIKACGELACGTVVWASADAQAKSLKASGKQILGLQLFQDMKKRPDGAWRGRAFVPDLNMTFAGSAEPLTAQTLKIKGCLVGNMFCRSQIWNRVG
jgi:uncharacterized protein (DUF2147 family)